VLLQLIVESITHRPLHDVIEDDLISRADLEHTSYPTTPRIPRPFSHGYLSTTSGLRDVTALNPAAGGGAGAMIATLDDLSVWARVVATGTLLRPETQRERLQFVDTHLPSPVKTSYGLGILNFQGFLGHNGAIYGFNTEMFYLPQTRATIVVVSNESNNVDGQATIAFYLIAKLLYPGLFSG
jgi:D-alanyl-D-alanine carboxypeptidase